jgi:hypothetical protein
MQSHMRYILWETTILMCLHSIKEWGYVVVLFLLYELTLLNIQVLLLFIQTLLHLGQIPTARSTQLPLSIVGRPTNLRPPQTSFHMTSFFR